MTSFTQQTDDLKPVISVNPRHRLSSINRNIYSGFTEHMGRCIYGGIYEPDSPLSDSQGFRKDVLDALRECEIPVVRYPGGNFCATYHWQDGIGPRERRPKRPELAWEGVESNRFGTDEFMAWCKELDCEPYLCFNFGTGTLDEAIAWLEYCNGTRDTHYANLRRENGHPEPYKVKYWALGNETWGPWQIEQMTQEAYAEKAYQWAKALKIVDPSIELVLCGKEGTTSWDHHVLSRCLQPAQSELGETLNVLVDMHSIHLYTTSEDHYENVTAPLAAERAIQVTSSLIDLARVENRIPSTQKRPSICFDEWNVWDPLRAIGSKGAEETYTLSDALAVAVWLNVFIRQSKDVQMACIAQTVNVISPLMTTKDGIQKQTTWWPYLLFCKYMRGWTIATHLSSGVYTGSTKRPWIRSIMNTPWLDVSASLDNDGYLSLAVVNIHKERDFETVVEGIEKRDGPVQVFSVTASHLQATNLKGTQEVDLHETSWDEAGDFVFPKHSFTMLRWKTK